MKNIYLIQRAKFIDKVGSKGIDSILSFDYMGSAEFEFGALPKSIKSIRDNIADYIYFEHRFKNSEKTVIVFCNNNVKGLLPEILNNLAKNSIRLKEYCDLRSWVYPPENEYETNDFWWDIDNDFMFWKNNQEFTTKFETLIKPINNG